MPEFSDWASLIAYLGQNHDIGDSVLINTGTLQVLVTIDRVAVISDSEITGA